MKKTLFLCLLNLTLICLAEQADVLWDFTKPQAAALQYRHLLPLQEESGLALTTAKADSGLIIKGVRIEPAKTPLIRITLSYSGFETAKVTGQVYFANEKHGGFSPSHYFHFTCDKLDDSRQVITLSPKNCIPNADVWIKGGIVNSMRFDFADQHPGKIHLEKIELCQESAKNVYDFSQPQPDWGNPYGMTLEQSDNALKMSIQKPDSRMVNKSIRLDTSRFRVLHIVYRAENFAVERTNGELFYGLESAPGISANRYVPLPSLKTDGKRHDIYLRLTWKTQEMVNLLRLDLVNQAPGIIYLDKLEFLEKAPDGMQATGLPKDWPPVVKPTLAKKLDPMRFYSFDEYFQGQLCFFPGRGEKPESAFLRHEFTVDFPVEKGWLQLMADDYVEEVYLNGAILRHPWSTDWRVTNLVTIPASSFRKGRNLLAIKYANTGGAGGVLYELAALGTNANFVRVNSGNEALFAVNPGAGWQLPETQPSSNTWKPAETRLPPPAMPWGQMLAYRNFEPENALGNLSDIQMSPRWEKGRLSVTGTLKASPSFSPKDTVLVIIRNEHGRELSRKEYSMESLSFREENGITHLTLAECDLAPYGGALAGTIQFRFRKRGVPSPIILPFNIPSRPLPGADTPTRAELLQAEGGPVLLLDGKVTYPFFLSVFSNSARIGREEKSGLEGADSPVTIREFTAGPKRNEWWIGDNQYDFECIDRLICFNLKEYPSAKIGLWVWCQPGAWYAKAHPERIALDSRGKPFDYYAATVTFSGKEYREDAKRALQAFVRHCETHFGNKIAIYNLCGGISLEWQAWGSHSGHKTKSLFDYSQTAKRDFREYSQNASGTPMDIPAYEARQSRDGALFRHPLQDKAAILYSEFTSESVAGCIRECAAAVRQALGLRRKLVGAYYGYIYEYGQYVWCINAAGHNAIALLLDCPDIDYLLSPNSYYNRGIGETNADMKPFASLRAHGKFSILEDDTRTHLINWTDNGQTRQTLNETQTINLLRRNWGMALARKMPICQLPLNEGRDLRSLLIRKDLDTTRKMGQRLFEGNRKSGVEMAFVMDEKSLKYLTPQTRRVPEPNHPIFAYDNPAGVLRRIERSVQILTGSLITEQRDRMAKSGAPYDQVLLMDVPRLAKQYKLWVIATAFSASEELKAALAALKNEKVTIVILYGAAFISEQNLFDLPVMSNYLGMNMALLPAGTTEIRTNNGVKFGLDSTLPHRFAVRDSKATVLGRYADGGEAALASVPYGSAKLVFCGAPMVPPDLLAEWLEKAGGHLFTAPGDVLHAGYGIVTLHTVSAGTKQLCFPKPVDLWDVYEQKYAARGIREYSFNAKALETKVFYATEP